MSFTTVCLDCLKPIDGVSRRCRLCAGRYRKEMGVSNGGRPKGIPMSKEFCEAQSKRLRGKGYVERYGAERAVKICLLHSKNNLEHPEWHVRFRHNTPHTEESKQKMCASIRKTWENGRVHWAKGTHGHPSILKAVGNSPIIKKGCLNPNYRDGSGSLPYPPDFSKELKHQVRDIRDEGLCQMPGCYVLQNGRKHSVHHIDYDKTNNVLANLITLCSKCHSKTTRGDKVQWAEFFQELQTMRGLK